MCPVAKHAIDVDYQQIFLCHFEKREQTKAGEDFAEKVDVAKNYLSNREGVKAALCLDVLSKGSFAPLNSLRQLACFYQMTKYEEWVFHV